MDLILNFDNLLTTHAIPFGIKIISALVIFIIGRYVTKIFVNVLKNILTKLELDKILVNFVGSIVKALLLFRSAMYTLATLLIYAALVNGLGDSNSPKVAKAFS